MSAVRVSVPGRSPQLVPDVDPWAHLTARQRRVAEVLFAHRGHRTHAAAELGMTVAGVQTMVTRLRARGIRVPPGHGRGPDLRPRRGLRPPCGRQMPQGSTCARGERHAGGCRSLRAIERERAAQSRQERTGSRAA